jgi:hypothetical protein
VWGLQERLHALLRLSRHELAAKRIDLPRQICLVIELDAGDPALARSNSILQFSCDLKDRY